MDLTRYAKDGLHSAACDTSRRLSGHGCGNGIGFGLGYNIYVDGCTGPDMYNNECTMLYYSAISRMSVFYKLALPSVGSQKTTYTILHNGGGSNNHGAGIGCGVIHNNSENIVTDNSARSWCYKIIPVEAAIGQIHS